ncbi:MAG: hypothetical protein ACP5DY_05530, partial [Thermovirgaceae bacterium]
SETLPVSPECYGCMDCVAVCPRGALRIETLGLEGDAGSAPRKGDSGKRDKKDGPADDRDQVA